MMQYSEEEVIKMMEAYGELQVQAEALHLLSKTISLETGIGKRQHIQKSLTKTALEIFEEDVPAEIRQKLDFKKEELEKSLRGYDKERRETYMYYKRTRKSLSNTVK